MFGVAALAASACSTLGAILTSGELRWLFVTFTACILTSSFLALIFKKAEESIRIVVGRCGLSMLSGILGAKYIVEKYHIEIVATDAIALAGIASALCIVGFILGYALLKLSDRNANKFADAIFKKFFGSTD